MFISSLLVGNNVVLVVYGITISYLINPLLQGLFHNEALVLICNTVISTTIILICGEFFPKTTFRINPNFTMRILALPLFIIYIVLYPVSWLISIISKGLMKLFSISSVKNINEKLTIDEIDEYLQESLNARKDKKDVENEVKIFRNAIDFKDTPIDACMIPRNEIIAVNIASTSRDELIRKFIATGLSKIVVFREDIDDVVGYIHVSELFDPECDWTCKLKPVIFTPETMLANKMMRRMLNEKRSLAIVVDEFGGTSGLVTLEDLVEEILGDIEDEHDRKKLRAIRISDTSIEAAGRAEIEYLNEEFALSIPESEEYHTLAGYILENLEALPSEGDTFTIDDLKLTILKMSVTKIELVRIDLLEPKTDKRD
jgi:CBS domain containing-hemolysin-like protein